MVFEVPQEFNIGDIFLPNGRFFDVQDSMYYITELHYIQAFGSKLIFLRGVVLVLSYIYYTILSKYHSLIH